jgi:CRISPR/Cas system-associated exonuclease Cas4 (RecB family)
VLLHQSDLKSYGRCAEQYRLQQAGAPREQLSATAYGSVMHHALHVLERTGNLQAALETFEFYWHPLNIEAICEPVQIWITGQSYGSLRLRGLDAIRKYHDLGKFKVGELLALEFEFVVPIHGTVDRQTGEPHYLGGTVDRLNLTSYQRKPVVAAEDFKTGKRPEYLRHDLQGTAYCYASEQPEFWIGNPAWNTDGFGLERGTDLLQRTDGAARRFTWIDLKALKYVDGGFRGPRDYERFRLAVQSIADAIQAEIFPLSISGEHCQHCPFRAICGGVGLDDRDGDPRPL